MKEKRKREKREPSIFLRLLVSVIMLAVIAYFGNMAVRFCMGLFMTGEEYIVAFPGEDSPIAQHSAQSTPTEPTGNQEGVQYVTEVARGDMTVTGDLMMHLPIVRSGKDGSTYNFDDIFKYVSSYVSDADYAVVNLETTLSGIDGNEYTGYPKFNSPDTVATSAKNAGFDMLLTANNHCYDYGTAGLKRTLEVIQENGLSSLGTTSTAEAPGHVVKDVGGVKIGMVCYSYGDIGDDPDRPAMNGLSTDSSASGLINAFDYDKLDLFYEEMTAHIDDLRLKGAETIVLFIHWGEEFSTSVNDSQRTIAQKMCDLGVDVIAGSHPHVVQPMELLTSTADETHKTVCLYSMGNFLSNQRATNISLTTGHSEDSLLLNLTFVKYSDGSVYLDDVSVQPTWVLVRGSGNDRVYHILPLDYQITDWEKAFDISSSQAADAKASYNRTMELINSGLKEVQAYLDAAHAERQAYVSVG